jgi:hypothetical protein
MNKLKTPDNFDDPEIDTAEELASFSYEALAAETSAIVQEVQELKTYTELALACLSLIATDAEAWANLGTLVRRNYDPSNPAAAIEAELEEIVAMQAEALKKEIS